MRRVNHSSCRTNFMATTRGRTTSEQSRLRMGPIPIQLPNLEIWRRLSQFCSYLMLKKSSTGRGLNDQRTPNNHDLFFLIQINGGNPIFFSFLLVFFLIFDLYCLSFIFYIIFWLVFTFVNNNPQIMRQCLLLTPQ